MHLDATNFSYADKCKAGKISFSLYCSSNNVKKVALKGFYNTQ